MKPIVITGWRGVMRNWWLVAEATAAEARAALRL